jgi:uncharacterized protein YaaN involved in tellurite resistance
MPTKNEMMKFAEIIEEMVEKKNYNYIEAIVEYCKESGLEIEVVSTLIDKNLKSKIESTAIDLRMLPRSNKLPI